MVCEEVMCFNIGECWLCGMVMFMLMGYICICVCCFCVVDIGNLMGKLDFDELCSVVDLVWLMDLKYVVLILVDCDDLFDGGVYYFVKMVKVIKEVNLQICVEVLMFDFGGNMVCVDFVLDSGVDIYVQNFEIVWCLIYLVCDICVSYDCILSVLVYVKQVCFDVIIKMSFMLGLGEICEEICEVMVDCCVVGVDVFIFGQYLCFIMYYLLVECYILFVEFDEICEEGM